MKKMMIAAAVAALVGGAFADACNEDCTSECTTPCQFGYRLKVMVRTTVACTVGSVGACGECSNATYRKPAIRRFVGAVYGISNTENNPSLCKEGCACNDWKDNAYIAMWDYDNASPVALDADATELLQLNRVGCSAAETMKAEMLFKLGLLCADGKVREMMFAGFGLCGDHDGKITLGQVQGYCAGQLPAGATYMQNCKEVSTCTTRAWNLCCNTAFECGFTAAYGKWTLVWDSGIAAKAGTAGNLNNADALKATVSAGTADAVLLKDARPCEDAECTTCVE